MLHKRTILWYRIPRDFSVAQYGFKLQYVESKPSCFSSQGLLFSQATVYLWVNHSKFEPFPFCHTCIEVYACSGCPEFQMHCHKFSKPAENLCQGCGFMPLRNFFLWGSTSIMPQISWKYMVIVNFKDQLCP